MPRRVAAGLAAVCFLALVAPLSAARADTLPIDDPTGLIDKPAGDGVFKVGVGVADATWQVGAGAGQYADKEPADPSGDVDPQQHSIAQRDSYGVASRLSMRAIVLEGTNGRRIALLKSDNYLAQNHLLRRVGQLLQLAGSAITANDILHSATHNHSSPYYSTPSWGVWVFQDAMDLRAFEYQARAMRDAILAAEANLQPAQMGATVVEVDPHEAFKGNIAGNGVGEDGSPVGYPSDFGDMGLTVLRFDSIAGDPIAVWANWGEHPESLDGYDLITADYLGPLQRFVQRETGAPLVFSQGDVGSAEGPYERGNNTTLASGPMAGTLRAWAHVGHAQMERGARLLANSLIEGWNAIGSGNVEVPLTSDVPVDAMTYWAPGPVSHPYPSVSNCRTKQTAEGDIGMVVTGLPDCDRGDGIVPVPDSPISLPFENLKAEGLPVPENYDAPAFGGVEENLRLELQVARIGDVILGSCSCEAQVDLILNFESRANKVQNDLWDGFPWDAYCDQNADGSWACPDPRRNDLTDRSLTVSDQAYQLMHAEIHNDARGWDAPENAPSANAEPTDPAQIKGNFTKEELPENLGYVIAVGLGHTGDYNGYTVSYREYMSRDSYRKALTSYGPHTADYMVTRLVRMAGALKGGPPLPIDPGIDPADEARQEAMSQALGRSAGAAYDAWHAGLADDAGVAAALTQPHDITRFDAATFSWRGGSNAIDNPTVRVERFDDVTAEWAPFADQSGEIPTMVDMPTSIEGVAQTWSGQQEWLWTANFEAFDGFPALLGQTPTGTYRFVVDGAMRTAHATSAYHLESDAFAVTPWEGISVSDLAVNHRDVSFVIDPILYPRTYTSTFPYVRDDGNPRLCRTCSFRPWAREGTAKSATVTVTNARGKVVRRVEAASVNGRWVANTDLRHNEVAWLERGAVRDVWGEGNHDDYGIRADGSLVPATAALTKVTPTVIPTVESSLPISSSRAPYVIPSGALVAVALITFIVRRNRRCAVS